MNAGVADHPRPQLELGLDELAGVGDRHLHQFAAALLEIYLEVFGGDPRRIAQLVEHLGRRAGRREQADPGLDAEAVKAGFGDGRQVGDRAVALRREQRDAAHLLRGDVGQCGRRRIEHEVDTARQHVDIGAADGAIGHLDHGGAGAPHESGADDLLAAAGAGMGDGELAGALPPVADDLGEVLLRQVGARHHHIGKGIDEGDRHEVIELVADLLIEREVEGHVAQAADQQRVAVGRRRGRRLGADQGARPGAVLDEEGLAHQLGQPVGEQPADVIVGAAGSDRYDDPDRPLGVIVRAGRSRHQQRHEREHEGGLDRDAGAFDHFVPPTSVCAHLNGSRRVVEQVAPDGRPGPPAMLVSKGSCRRQAVSTAPGRFANVRAGGRSMATDDERLDAMARWMWDARQRREAYRNLPDELRPASLADAYAAQEVYHRLAAPVYGVVAGAKIATTTKIMQQLMGISHPCAGAIFGRTIHASPARLRAADFVNLRIESEIALELGADVPASGAPWTAETIAPMVAGAMAAFELIEDRHADYAKSEASSLIVENCWNGGVVIGASKAMPMASLVGIAGKLAINGTVVGEGRAEDPCATLAWLANTLAERGRGLVAGMVVITGSVIPTVSVAPGDRAVFTVDGLGEAAMEVA